MSSESQKPPRKAVGVVLSSNQESITGGPGLARTFEDKRKREQSLAPKTSGGTVMGVAPPAGINPALEDDLTFDEVVPRPSKPVSAMDVPPKKGILARFGAWLIAFVRRFFPWSRDRS